MPLVKPSSRTHAETMMPAKLTCTRVSPSANATAENHREGYEAGMDEYITKPIYPSKLKELLAKPKRMQTVLEFDDGADGDAEVTSLIGRNGSG